MQSTINNFENKIALITGGSRGIGKQVSIKLATLGATTIINYNTNKNEALLTQTSIIEKGGKAEIFKADMSNIKEIESLYNYIQKTYKQLDILVNSAGICQIIDYSNISEDDWDKMMEVNLKGTFFSCQKALEIMTPQKSGKIINVASTAGQMGGFIVGVNYAVSKAGVICLTKSLSKPAIKNGIHINCVAPGLIDTDMVDAFPTQLVANMKNNIPINRLGTSSEVADSIVFLASEQSSYFVGATLYINGGTYLG
ncbi:MAG: SDR family oxidoreductase [Alphaproteobacteria bacterium]|nr:SDR family oxidoreductase [Alphaproteobacteria bacterium]